MSLAEQLAHVDGARVAAAGLERELAVRAFAAGFAAGADPRRARNRHQVDPATHAHWRRGFDRGREIAEAAAAAYRAELGAARRGGAA